ncbi:MAG: serine/threonine protein kinase [Armatimonadetes bacterium]|nr:serine/threonine protein kinase [Armatimonadota bacterium]
MSGSLIHSPLPSGTVLDKRYRIKELIKAGGYGATYKAEDTCVDGKTVALKEMLDTFQDADERQVGIRNFLAEIQILQRLAHPNIPRISDQFMAGASFFFVMDYIEGTDLSTLLRENNGEGFEEQDVLEWGAQVCDALAYVHKLKPKPVIHRDIKPSNLIRRDRDMRIMVVDFGIAGVYNPNKDRWVGTPGYAPPEQQWNQDSVDGRADIYALGASLHHLLSGQRPESPENAHFTDLPFSQWFSNHQEPFTHMKPLNQLRPDLSEECCRLVAKALFWNPDDRYGSATEMLEALRALVPGCGQPEPDVQHDFRLRVREAQAKWIEPALREIARRFPGRCLTPSIPSEYDYFVFSLASFTPLELHIKVNPDALAIEFYRKQGLLQKDLLGTADLRGATAGTEIAGIIREFIEDFESF